MKSSTTQSLYLLELSYNLCLVERKKLRRKKEKKGHKSPTQVNENFFISTFAFWIYASKLRFTFLMCIHEELGEVLLLLLCFILLLVCGFCWVARFLVEFGFRGSEKREGIETRGCEQLKSLSKLVSFHSKDLLLILQFIVELNLKWVWHTFTNKNTHIHSNADNLLHNMKSGECNKMLLRAPINYHTQLVANVIMKECESEKVSGYASICWWKFKLLLTFLLLVCCSTFFFPQTTKILRTLFRVWENDKSNDLSVRLVLNYIKDLMVCIRKPNMLKYEI